MRARAPVREHSPRRDQPLFPLRAKLGDRLELLVVEHSRREVELRLDVRLLGLRAEVARVTRRAQQEADRLREDGLSGARLARDGVEPLAQGDVGLANEHEVLDAQATEHQRRA